MATANDDTEEILYGLDAHRTSLRLQSTSRPSSPCIDSPRRGSESEGEDDEGTLPSQLRYARRWAHRPTLAQHSNVMVIKPEQQGSNRSIRRPLATQFRDSWETTSLSTPLVHDDSLHVAQHIHVDKHLTHSVDKRLSLPLERGGSCDPTWVQSLHAIQEDRAHGQHGLSRVSSCSSMRQQAIVLRTPERILMLNSPLPRMSASYDHIPPTDMHKFADRTKVPVHRSPASQDFQHAYDLHDVRIGISHPVAPASQRRGPVLSRVVTSLSPPPSPRVPVHTVYDLAPHWQRPATRQGSEPPTPAPIVESDGLYKSAARRMPTLRRRTSIRETPSGIAPVWASDASSPSYSQTEFNLGPAARAAGSQSVPVQVSRSPRLQHHQSLLPLPPSASVPISTSQPAPASPLSSSSSPLTPPSWLSRSLGSWRSRRPKTKSAQETEMNTRSNAAGAPVVWAQKSKPSPSGPSEPPGEDRRRNPRGPQVIW
ncbi:unnamed protein product [Parajaminaea phylloscopi]